MTAQVLTVPNALSSLRLLLVPVVTWLMWTGRNDLLAAILLSIAAASDWFDGWLARRLNQVSKVGTLLDPLADRLALVSFAVALTVRGILPIAITVAVVARDLMLTALLPRLRRQGVWALPVTFTGKAATFGLLSGILISYAAAVLSSSLVAVLGITIVVLGATLYWIAGVGYVRMSMVRVSQPEPAAKEASPLERTS